MLRIQNEITKLNNLNPFNSIDNNEINTILLDFSTLFWLLRDKKLTKTTFFVQLIENDFLRQYIKTVCGFTDDLELYRELISRNPCVCNSKMIKNRLSFANKLANIKK